MTAVREDLPVFTSRISQFKSELTELIELGADPTDKLIDLMEMINDLRDNPEFLYETYESRMYKYTRPNLLHLAELTKVMVDKSPKRDAVIIEYLDRSCETSFSAS